MPVARRFHSGLTGCFRMIDYTQRLTRLMGDIVARVPSLAYIDMTEILVFARFGRSDADGAFATCHCLNLPASEPGHYFWCDRRTGRTTRRSEWFVMKSPRLEIVGRRIDYLISFSLPRFCDQTLERSRKVDSYRGFDPWIAKLDTVVHELYHVDPNESGIRRIDRADGLPSRHSHSPAFFTTVAKLVKQYLSTNPDPATYGFLQFDFSQIIERHGGLMGATFRIFPSFPQRYLEIMAKQPRRRADDGVVIEPIRRSAGPTHFTERDVILREFRRTGSRRCAPAGGSLAA